MFAKSGRSTKRLIVGYLGVAMGSTLILLSANAGLAAAAPKLDKLEVEGLCTLPNDGFAVMLVSNSNSVEVAYKWDIDKTSSPPDLRRRQADPCSEAGLRRVRLPRAASEALGRRRRSSARLARRAQVVEADARKRRRDRDLHVEEG